MKTLIPSLTLLACVTQSLAAPPANDAFTTPAPLAFGGPSLTVEGDNTQAGSEPGEPAPYHTNGKTLWWAWQAPGNGPVTFRVLPSSFGVWVYTGSAVDSLSWVPTASYTLDERAFKTFDAVAGTTYRFQVTGAEPFWEATGPFTVQFGLPGRPPNDAFASRALLSGRAAVARGATVGATLEPGEPTGQTAALAQSVWWTWQAPASGTATVARLNPAGLPNAEVDPTLLVYTGASLSSLTLLASNRSGIGIVPETSFAAQAGQDYHLCVNAPSGSQSPVAFWVSLDGAALLENPALSPEGFQFNLIGAAFRAYALESASALAGWESFATNTGGYYDPRPVLDPRPPAAGLRFYRARLLAP